MKESAFLKEMVGFRRRQERKKREENKKRKKMQGKPGASLCQEEKKIKI